MKNSVIVLAAGALTVAAGLALAQSQETESMEGMDHSGMQMSDDPGMQALMDAMNTMMENTPVESTGDIDADFLLMMIPHHQSAIDMALVVLERGDDEETKALAQAVIDTQEAEIAQMRSILEQLGVEPPVAE
jgi:uncharacterized protein (DUF305 family)